MALRFALNNARVALANTRKGPTCVAPTLSSMRKLSTVDDSSEFTFDIPVSYKLHRLEEGPSSSSTLTKGELMTMYREMHAVRKMELALDSEYKIRNVRGFCHLSDGQEAVGVGVEHALTRQDDWITSYRCHGISYLRGQTIEAVIAELMGKKTGATKGKGGSMHLYDRENNFWGGQGIVGAQVPVGVGQAFANHYNRTVVEGKNPEDDPMNVAAIFFGDGAANQGQIWEAANMARLWKLPAIIVCENNEYGMGTSVDRHSSVGNEQGYYTQGNVIPGVWCDGMDVLAVKECFAFCKDFASKGNGPIYVEVQTYRYHGHSMSDPGLVYRAREEVKEVRANRDCIVGLKNRLLDNEIATKEELTAIEKSVRAEVEDAVKKSRDAGVPDIEELYNDIYWNGEKSYIRGVEYNSSIHP